MRKIVLYGAFDRYNYGDNLMPILLKLYIEKFHSDLLKIYSLEFASITKSDLSNYCCLKTRPLNEALSGLGKGSVVIVVGGEVVGAKSEILFLHSFKSQPVYKFFRSLKWRSPIIYSFFVRLAFRNVSELPYVIVGEKTKVFFNTVGGRVPIDNNELREKCIAALRYSNHISVRDKRTFSAMSEYVEPKLIPDSVHAITKLIDDDFLAQRISGKVTALKVSEYIVFQASPIKLSTDIKVLIDSLKRAHDVSKCKIVLLPIGYATGHDDVELLNEINKNLVNETLLLTELNVWEIMFVIKNAIAFYGTSLHGVITALAFGRPHFCINKNIDKLNSYINDWSIFPYNESIEPQEIADTLKRSHDLEAIKQKSCELADLVFFNNNSMFDSLYKKEAK